MSAFKMTPRQPRSERGRSFVLRKACGSPFLLRKHNCSQNEVHYLAISSEFACLRFRRA
jgi:hypothetical protein